MANPLMAMMQGGNPMQMLQNNPVIQMVNMMKNGGNPMGMLQQMAGQNPQAKQAFDMMNAGNTQGLKEMAMNMAKERGTTPEEIIKGLGMSMPNG